MTDQLGTRRIILKLLCTKKKKQFC